MFLLLITNRVLHLLAECPSSRHKPVFGFFRLRISVWTEPGTYRLCLCLTHPSAGLQTCPGSSRHLLLPPLCSFQLARRAGVKDLRASLEVQHFVSVCRTRGASHAWPPSLLLASVESFLERYAGVVCRCSQRFLMHVCVIKGCVCSLSVQGVKHIYIHINIYI